MARERMVTRTVSATTLTVLFMDTENQKPVSKDVVTGETFDDSEKALKWVKKHNTDINLVPCAIMNTATTETLYGMPEADFIKMAKILPPRKVGETEAE